ncbi:MAG: hypothetical protein IJA35_03495 [Clostridia bacterium]|nr:hypothetical protein [Clostridia bacterium]
MKFLMEKFRSERCVAVMFVIIQAFCLFTLVYSAIQNNVQSILLCAVEILVLLWLPWIFERIFAITLSNFLKIVLLIFCIAGPILGAVYHLYQIIPFWDLLLHTLNGFLFAHIGLNLLYEFNKKKNYSSIYAVALASAFCFSMTIGVLWEFFEHGMDVFFKTDMQNDSIVYDIYSYYLGGGLGQTGSINGITETIINGTALNFEGYLDIGLLDTMSDMLVNFIGACVFLVVDIVFLRKRRTPLGSDI